MNDKFTWPLEARQRLQQLLATTDMTFKTIAETLSKEFKCTLSRSAIAGEKRRLGMAQMAKLPKVRAKKMKKIRVDAPIVPEPPRRDPRPFTLLITDLDHSVCHWPSGEAWERPPFFYCGEPAVTGRPYCNAHMRKSVSNWVKS
jgi:hypothetical protein